MFSTAALKYVLSAALLAFFLIQMDWEVLLHGSLGLSSYLFLLSIVCVLCQIFFLNLRWHCYLNAGRASVPFRISVLINIAGYFANVIFITSVGGVIAKSGLAIKQGVPFFHAVFATLLDRFMTLAALIVLGLCGLPFLYDTLDSKVSMMFGAAMVFISLGVFMFLAMLRSGLLKDFIMSNRRRSRMIATLRSFTKDRHLMKITAVHSIIAQAFFILSVYVLSLGFDGNSASAIEFLALMPVLAFISSLPISFGGWGVREGAFIYGLGLIGFSMESAFLLSVQVGLVGLIAPFVVGLPYLYQDELKNFITPNVPKKHS
jgi:hypothetical protein